MKDFLSKVQTAAKNMGSGPYDDKKTEEILLEATRRTTDYCKRLKELRRKKECSQ